MSAASYDADMAYGRANRAAAAGDLDAAEAGYRDALVLDPGYAEAHNNLGNVMMARRAYDQAVICYRSALDNGLIHPLVYYNLATAMRRNGMADAAGRAFQIALALHPDYAEAWNNLGNLRREQQYCDAAAIAYLRALAVAPGWEEAHDNLSGALYLLHDAGGPTVSSGHARRWLDRHPDHPVARHLGAALLGEGGDGRAGDAYVRQVFDSFADEFDAKLLSLEYQAPALLVAALEAQDTAGAGGVAIKAGGLDILDAGCGTGLCGPLLQPWARRLDGVDLSPEMLARAGLRAVYDDLHEGELTAFLSGRLAAYDVIVAADVLCYFGVLAEVLPAMAATLRPGGRLAFSVEALPADEPAPYRLLPHGRYAHSGPAVAALLAAAGLTVLSFEPAVLRYESGQPVHGHIVVAAM